MINSNFEKHSQFENSKNRIILELQIGQNEIEQERHFISQKATF